MITVHRLFHLFTACWHECGPVKVPLKGCQGGATISRNIQRCCKCGKAIRYEVSMYG